MKMGRHSRIQMCEVNPLLIFSKHHVMRKVSAVLVHFCFDGDFSNFNVASILR